MSPKKIAINMENYPQNLKNIYKAPDFLFIEGEILPEDENAIAIVGTRMPSYYGLEQCRKISFELALRGITIISGMARGIDTAAHRGALQAGGRTIAVLGSGHENLYPPENKKLYGEIVKSGSVISEFPPDTPPYRANFPRRNRIISGLSRGVLVVEAPLRSGSLITADFALEQGREVFAMPGNINSAKSSGTNKLIKEGAKLVESASDILEELVHVLKFKKEEIVYGGKSSTEEPRVTGKEKEILDVVGNGPTPIGEIYEKTGISSGKLSEILLKLEIKRLVKALPGERFVRI